MAGKTLGEIIKIKDDAQRRMTEAMTAVVKSKKVDPDQAVKELDRMIAQQGERIEATKVAMADAVSRFEADVKLREVRITELKELQKHYKEGGGVGPTGDVQLRNVRGIGPVAEDRLRKNGILSVKALSEASPAKIAKILDVSVDKAVEFVKEAKRLLRR